MEAKLDKLMEEVQQSREEVCQSRREVEASKKEPEDKFASSISELKREVNIVQEKASQQLKRIGSSAYQFRRKGMNISATLTLEYKIPSIRPSWS